ncbi:MAG: recombinase zinc beta ribbon domain-containing protein [Elusimicrobia bacterium]|nr:recombinase zinc beta ribbon domain-containing protein [Elusimicrobiota bacterium]
MAHRRNGKKKRPQKYFMFRGLFWCGECGAMFTTEQQKGHNYYRCTRKKGACYQPYVREEVLKEQVLAEVKKFLLPGDWADRMLEEIQIRYQQSAQSRESSAQALRDEIAATEARLDKLVDAFISGDMEKDDYQRKRRELVAAKMDLKTKLEGLGRNSDFRLEPAKKLINWSKELNKSVFEGNWRALVQSLENLGSNHTIQNKTARLSVENQFAVLAEAGRCVKWRGRRDLNPRSPP